MVRNNSSNINGVLFDWDMTLARAIGDVPRSQILTFLFQRGGFTCSHKAVQEAMAIFQQAHARGLYPTVNMPPQTQQDIALYYRHLLELMGYAQVSMRKVLLLYHDYAHLPTSLYDDVPPILQALHSRGMILGVISNHSQAARPMMQQELGQYIAQEHIIISDEIGAYKPIPFVFRQAAASLNLPPEQCAYVGDNLEVDAIGAVEQGGFGLGLWLDRQNKGLPRPLPENVARICTLAELLDYL